MVSLFLIIVLAEGGDSSWRRTGEAKEGWGHGGLGKRRWLSMLCLPLLPHMQLSDGKVLMSSPQRLTFAAPLTAADPSGQDPCLHCHCRSTLPGQATAASICCSSLGWV